MKTKEKETQIERICFNCGAFFPASNGVIDEFGICLNDPEFDSFVDDILDHQDYTSCQWLVDRKKFSGNRQACSEFEPVEALEIVEDNTPLARDLKHLMEAGELNAETFKQALIEDQVRNINWTTMPVDRQKEELKDPDTQARAVKSLGAMISLGNQEAFTVLSEFLKSLPSPRAIEEVHFRMDILRHLRWSRDSKKILPTLIDELYRTPSNNTTRQWISDILKFMEHMPFEQVCEPLEQMIRDKRFSHKLKQKMKSVLARVMQ